MKFKKKKFLIIGGVILFFIVTSSSSETTDSVANESNENVAQDNKEINEESIDKSEQVASEAVDEKQVEEESKESDVSKQPEHTVELSQLLKEYSDNQIAADEKYKDKFITVNGYFSNTYDLLGMKLSLKSDDPLQIKTLEIPIEKDSENYEKVLSLKEGDQVSVTGTLDTDAGLNIKMKNDTVIN